MTEKQLRAMKEGMKACEDYIHGKIEEPLNPYLRTMEEYDFWNKGWYFCYNGE